MFTKLLKNNLLHSITFLENLYSHIILKRIIFNIWTYNIKKTLMKYLFYSLKNFCTIKFKKVS
jgi:hypothetical protein